ncbi:MAG: hypothetical protein D6760_03860 [Deltaproteobacteria bacterium]|nr:MAG: hypothetical protein D6760_03860 [Deltaproteobacteria bacterium]
MKDQLARDAEVFFVAVLGAALVLLGGGLLFESLSAGASQATLSSRIAAVRAVRALYAWFGLLPAGLAFLGIGVPFALRTLLAAATRRLGRRQTLALIGVATGVALLLTPYGKGWKAPLLLCSIAAVAAAGGGGLLRRHAAAWGRILLALASLSFLAVTVFAERIAAGTAPSTVLGPTALAAAGFFLIPAFGCAVAATLAGIVRWYWTALLTLSATLWYGLPWIRAWGRAAGAPGDPIEVAVTGVLAGVLAVAAWKSAPAPHRRRRAP